jgi:hypothetical protein
MLDDWASNNRAPGFEGSGRPTMNGGRATTLNVSAAADVATPSFQHGHDPAVGAAQLAPRRTVAPYDDPHLAWLVQTYLHTPEGAAILAQHEPQTDPEAGAAARQYGAYALQDAGTLPVDTETFEQHFLEAEPGPEVQPALLKQDRNALRLVALLASIAVVLVSGALLTVLMTQNQPEAIANTAKPELAPRSFAVAVECPFMNAPVTMAVVAPRLANAIEATRSALSNCTIMAGDFDKQSNRR